MFILQSESGTVPFKNVYIVKLDPEELWKISTLPFYHKTKYSCGFGLCYHVDFVIPSNIDEENSEREARVPIIK